MKLTKLVVDEIASRLEFEGPIAYNGNWYTAGDVGVAQCGDIYWCEYSKCPKVSDGANGLRLILTQCPKPNVKYWRLRDSPDIIAKTCNGLFMEPLWNEITPALYADLSKAQVAVQPLEKTDDDNFDADTLVNKLNELIRAVNALTSCGLSPAMTGLRPPNN